MQTMPYLFFNGNCEEAFKFYEKTLNGTINAMMTHAGTPMEENVDEDWRKKIIHAKMQVGDAILMASDCPPDQYEAPKGFSINIAVDSPEEAKRVFDALADGGSIQMALEKTFWAKSFGMVTDRYGIPWMINCE